MINKFLCRLWGHVTKDEYGEVECRLLKHGPPPYKFTEHTIKISHKKCIHCGERFYNN